MNMRIGSLCSGYGGLDLAVAEVFDAQTVWHADDDPDAAKVLAARWPGVPNFGDLREVDWGAAAPVDVVTAGFPCQPVSCAGKRAGMSDERWLWDDVATAVGLMEPRPTLLVFENVPRLLSSDRGDAMAGVVSRLARMGYVGSWGIVRASDLGAPHQRKRWFCVARLADAPVAGLEARRQGRIGGGAASHAQGQRHRDAGSQGVPGVQAAVVAGAVADADGDRREVVERIESGVGSRSDVDGRGQVDWGEYAPAIRRWEHVVGRPAPIPSEPGRRGGGPCLSPRFSEWMMGLPAGWVCDVDISRIAQLRIIGNGVVPQQGAAAIAVLTAM